MLLADDGQLAANPHPLAVLIQADGDGTVEYKTAKRSSSSKSQLQKEMDKKKEHAAVQEGAFLTIRSFASFFCFATPR